MQLFYEHLGFFRSTSVRMRFVKLEVCRRKEARKCLCFLVRCTTDDPLRRQRVDGLMLLGKAEQLFFKPEKRDFILTPCVNPVCINLTLMSSLVCTALCETAG